MLIPARPECKENESKKKGGGRIKGPRGVFQQKLVYKSRYSGGISLCVWTGLNLDFGNGVK